MRFDAHGVFVGHVDLDEPVAVDADAEALVRK
jgi:hypothetical protein